LGVENSYAAFCLDEVIVLWGESLQAELEKVAEKAKTQKAAENKQKLVLTKWLGLDKKPSGQKKFADPGAQAKKG
jgi:hypothetical protein